MPSVATRFTSFVILQPVIAGAGVSPTSLLGITERPVVGAAK